MLSGPLAGQLAQAFAIAILDAAILSWIALHWYRRAVTRQMQRRAAADGGVVPPPLPPPMPLTPPPGHEQLRVALFHASGADAGTDAREWPGGWRRLALAYSVGAALFAAVITAASMRGTPDWAPMMVFGLWWMNVWPIVPTLILVLLLDRRSAVRVTAAYVLAGMVTLAVVTILQQVSRGTLNSAALTNGVQLVVGIAVTASVPLVVLLGVSWPRIRAVMPLALASTLFFGLALIIFREGLMRALNDPALRNVLLGLGELTSTQIAMYALYMVLALPAGWLAWRSLRALAAAFERKRFSDVQLVVDCWWLIVTAEKIATLASPLGFAAIAVGIGAFAAYRVGTFAMLRALRAEGTESARRLLLLRVFGYQGRTESLFDRIAQRWRFRGPVQLIAGSDLAMRTADPGDILAFVGGRLPDVYVSRVEDVAERVQRLDMGRDPDGRFRVNDVFCLNETWRDALQHLLAVTDVVVMDLRGFTAGRTGCVFELQQLVTRVPIGAIVLVTDRTTDLAALANVLGLAWAAARRESGTRSADPLSIVRVERGSVRELDALMERLLGRSAPQQVVPVGDLAAALA